MPRINTDHTVNGTGGDMDAARNPIKMAAAAIKAASFHIPRNTHIVTLPHLENDASGRYPHDQPGHAVYFTGKPHYLSQKRESHAKIALLDKALQPARISSMPRKRHTQFWTHRYKMQYKFLKC